MFTRTLLLSAVPILLLACGGDAPPDGDDTVYPPDQAGPFNTGVEADEVESSAGLTLPVQIWYPTKSEGEQTYEYPLAPDLGTAQVNQPARCPTPLPVALFSHGNGGLRYQSVFLTEHLASHGYLVAAPDHVGNTILDLDSIPGYEVGARRPLDIAETFDYLVDRSADPDDLLFGCVDEDAGYALLGHSFGGWTTLLTAGASVNLDGLTETCPEGGDFLCGLETVWTADSTRGLHDPRVWAAVPITPVGAFSLGEGLADIEVPTLVIGGLIDTVTVWDVEVEPIYQQLTVPERALAGLENTGHYGFSHFCIDLLSPNCGDESLASEEVHRITNGLALSWLRQVRGEEGVVLPPDESIVVWEAP